VLDALKRQALNIRQPSHFCTPALRELEFVERAQICPRLYPLFREDLAVHEQRKRIWIDRLQTLMTIRVLVYCLLYQGAIWLVVHVIGQYWEALGSVAGVVPGVHFGIVTILAIVTFMGIVTYDVIHYVHRLVGPIYRFRKTCEAIANGEPVRPVFLRKHDFLMDFKDEFNRMLAVLEERGLVVVHDDRKQAAPEVAAPQVAAR
jgi:hypothetical protein